MSYHMPDPHQSTCTQTSHSVRSACPVFSNETLTVAFRPFARIVGLTETFPDHDVPARLGDLAQWKGPVDDWRDLPGFDEFLQSDEIRVAVLRDVRNQLLPPEARDQGSQEQGQDRWLLAARLSGQDMDPIRS